MENLNLCAYGVSEMSYHEIVKTEGGNPLLAWAIRLITTIAVADALYEAGEAFSAGFSEGWNDYGG